LIWRENLRLQGRGGRSLYNTDQKEGEYALSREEERKEDNKSRVHGDGSCGRRRPGIRKIMEIYYLFD